jgi:hypothetical protein
VTYTTQLSSIPLTQERIQELLDEQEGTNSTMYVYKKIKSLKIFVKPTPP